MFSYEAAKTIHLISVVGMFVTTTYSLVLMSKEGKVKNFASALQLFFGVLIFATAFWLAELLDLNSDFPVWGKIKTMIWLVLVILGILSTRKKFTSSKALFSSILILGILATAIAVFKPTF